MIKDACRIVRLNQSFLCAVERRTFLVSALTVPLAQGPTTLGQRVPTIEPRAQSTWSYDLHRED